MAEHGRHADSLAQSVRASGLEPQVRFCECSIGEGESENDIMSLESEVRTKGAFVALEGGGAKGLVHIGALKAMEERGFRFLGMAGTSAGAIIAALKAAGYTADEMFDTKSDCKKTILHLLPMKNGRHQIARDLFTTVGWAKISLLFAVGKLYANAFRYRLTSFAVLAAAAYVFAVNYWLYGRVFIKAVLITTPFFVVLAVAVAIMLARGLVSMQTLERSLNELLRLRIRPDDPNYVVKLRDFGRGKMRPSLKIVAANISTRRMELFDSHDNSDGGRLELPVAKIVAASACLPILFRSVGIGQNVYYDGGFVSNHPTWPFDAERAIDPDALTIGVAIDAVSHPERKLGTILSLVETVVSGAAILNHRAITGLVPLTVPTDLDTTDFDTDWERARREIDRARTSAALQLAHMVFEGPDAYLRACRDTQEAAMKVIDYFAFGGLDPAVRPVHRVRVGVAVKESADPISLRMRFCAGYEADTDEGIILPISGSITGEAWSTGNVVFVARMPIDERLDLNARSSRIVKKLICRDIRWLIAIPIYAKGTRRLSGEMPEFVVDIDGTAELPGNIDEDGLKKALKKLTVDYFVACITAVRELENAE